MCGLVGVITKNQNGFTKEQVDAFDNLLFIDALRGMDSTGVFLVDKEGNMDMAKEASPSFEYRTDEAYKVLQRTAFQRGRAMIGHNRAATKGSVVDENAHPFVVDDRITLCHNGTLWGDWAKLSDKKVDVDSHAIAHKIHECDDDVEKALQQVDGAYALIWHDFKHNTLNFVRNAQRPLHFVETQNGWLWASEANMLAWILARYTFKAEGPISELGAGTLVTYDFSNNSWKVDSKDIKLEAPKKHVPQQGYHRHASAWAGYVNGDDEGWDGTVFNLHPVCELPDPTPVQHMMGMQRKLQANNAGERIERAQLTGRTIANENALAAKWSMDIDSITFSKNSETIAEDQTWVKAICIDFEQIKPNSSMFGYFLYAQLNKSSDYLVKVFMPATTTDTDLLDWCLNGVELDFHIISRQWRCYTDAKDGQGFAILNADMVREFATTTTISPVALPEIL